MNEPRADQWLKLERTGEENQNRRMVAKVGTRY